MRPTSEGSWVRMVVNADEVELLLTRLLGEVQRARKIEDAWTRENGAAARPRRGEVRRSSRLSKVVTIAATTLGLAAIAVPWLFAPARTRPQPPAIALSHVPAPVPLPVRVPLLSAAPPLAEAVKPPAAPSPKRPRVEDSPAPRGVQHGYVPEL